MNKRCNCIDATAQIEERGRKKCLNDQLSIHAIRIEILRDKNVELYREKESIFMVETASKGGLKRSSMRGG